MRAGSGSRAGPVRKSLYGSSGSAPSTNASRCAASSSVCVSSDTQSMLRQAGTTPAPPTRPGVGFRPTSWLKPAGTRPEPAVSVPSAKATWPRATATAEPELEPPLMRWASNTLLGRP